MNEKVMVAGHICLDIAPRFGAHLKGGFNEILVPGKLINVEEAVLCTGGAISNTGLAMAKLGADVLLNGKVGDDGFGEIIKRLVGEEKARTFKTVAGENSSYTVILAIPGVDRIFLHNPGTNNTFVADDVDYKAVKDCVLFHFGYPPLMERMFENDGVMLAEIFRKVKKLGVTTSLDMSLPDPASQSGQVDWRKILEKVLPFVDIFVPSIEEITFMLDKPLFEKKKKLSAGSDPVFAYEPGEYTKISDELISLGVKIVTLKSGIRGYYLRTAAAEKIKTIGAARPRDIAVWSGRELWAASFKAEKFGSATGAGDATIAGFLCGLIRNFPPEDALKIANSVGWQNVREIDALSGIEDWQSNLEFIKDKNRPRNPLDIKAAGWKYSEEHQLFHGPMDRK